MAIVASEVERLAAALGRRIVIDSSLQATDLHITQVCPLCDAQLGVLITYAARTRPLRSALFSIYDEHRCVIALDPFTLFERAERALVASAERITLIDDLELRARAESEADLMAARAAELRAKL